MKVLGIETSCDDTGVCLIEADGDFGSDFQFKVLAYHLSSQAELHAQYGGVFPAMAKREHAKNLPPLVAEALKKTGTIDAIAVTFGPGLEPCLWEGITFTQKLAAERNIPVVAVNHMEGHILMSMMEISTNDSYASVLQKTAIEGRLAAFEFPALILLISGGHTELVLMRAFSQYEYLGRTRDDAVGEAFDKVARMLGLPYPGGPHISRLAAEAREKKENGVIFTPPMLHSSDYDFSFSGLKTEVMRYIQKQGELTDSMKRDIARAFEDAASNVLVAKTLRAADEYGATSLVLGGGVAANTHIKKKFAFWAKETGRQLLVTAPEFATDNGLMIALPGYFHALKKEFTDPASLKANGKLTL